MDIETEKIGHLSDIIQILKVMKLNVNDKIEVLNNELDYRGLEYENINSIADKICQLIIEKGDIELKILTISNILDEI